MNDDQHSAGNKHSDYADRIRNARLLADYIRTSLWDEKMNQRREYWLWERKGAATKKPEHYYMIKEFLP